MNSITEQTMIFAYELVTKRRLMRDPGSNSWKQFRIFRYLLAQEQGEAGAEMYEALGLTVTMGAALIRQMVEEKTVVREMKQGKARYRLGDEASSLARYALSVEYLPPLSDRELREANEVPDRAFDASRICGDKKELLAYLKQIVAMETVIMSYEGRYESLYALWQAAIRDGAGDYDAVRGQVNREIGEQTRELKELERAQPQVPTLQKQVAEPDTPPPAEPIFTAVMPIAPTYEKAGLFNRKKVEESNLRRKAEYDLQMQAYLQAEAVYRMQYQVYACERKDYLARLQRKQQALDEEAQARYHRACAEHESELAAYQSRLAERREALRMRKQGCEQRIAERMMTTPCGIRRGQIELELRYVTESLTEAIRTLHGLYSLGVVYGKYRDPVAVATFVDYLESGRCERLDGAHGTYNLYEQELRADLVLDKLDSVLSSLEQIKRNQYGIYREIKETNERLSRIEGKLVAMQQVQQDSLEQLRRIGKSTEDLSQRLEKIAFHTEVSAFYAKQIKELTDALGFLVALG